MRAILLIGIITLLACAPSAPYPLPGGWAHLPETKTRRGDLVAVGLPVPGGADSTYRQTLFCLSHSPCPRRWMDMFTYPPDDTTFITSIDAGTDSQGIVVQLDVRFNHRITFDSALRLYRSALGQPSSLGRDQSAYHPYAEWRRDDLLLRLFGTSPTRGAPATAYLSRSERLYGAPRRPDIAGSCGRVRSLATCFVPISGHKQRPNTRLEWSFAPGHPMDART